MTLTKDDFPIGTRVRVTDIQQARDVLKKWRAATPGPWSIGIGEVLSPSGDVTSGTYSWDARLIVGTAGNPDLLDAIDGVLVLASRLEDEGLSTAFLIRVERIAAAIIAADERMTQ